MAEANDFLNLLENDETTSGLTDMIDTIMNLPDEGLTDDTVESLSGMFTGAFTPTVKEDGINSIIHFFEANNYNRTNAVAAVQQVKGQFESIIISLSPSENKKKILNNFFNEIISLYEVALSRYHVNNIMLNITLDEGAQVPTYAHEHDAAADLYAADTVVLPPHSLSNKIRTGVHIQLPEGWMAMIFPRSSIGSKTGLRLSNSAGIIDNQYTGALGVLYDNMSDEPYTINAGDRIAQLMVMPSYQFTARVVDKLEETERNENGFGSSGT